MTISHAGYIKRNAVSLYKSQHRGGRGKMGMGTKEEDFVEKIFIASTHHYLACLYQRGESALVKGISNSSGRPCRKRQGYGQPG